ncbi:unnamed protein product [Hymenolepis diminuta]|uniref:Uncharacterized protein n=1 Tax=Hymenolepis diminuta TaxID=6216 RepID=A0A564XVD0_HYMDI|nr:unnamed protein product [Hymenolepis diminuta]
MKQYTFLILILELSKDLEIITYDLLQSQNEEIRADLKQGDNRQYFVMWKSGVFLLVNITHVGLSRVYEEVSHKGDNKYFLQMSNGPEQYENNQLEFQRIINKYCRTPIPDRYFIILQSYRNRYTMAYLDSSPTNQTQIWKSGVRSLPKLKRTLNKQCSRNIAAPLKDDDSAAESFYCTKDSPLLNNIFGQYAEESIFIKKPHDCSKFQQACLKCFEQANASRKLDQQKREDEKSKAMLWRAAGMQFYVIATLHPRHNH